MRLYTRTGATTLDDPEFGHFEADENGSFLLPEELAERLRRFHVGGLPAWETDVERQRRLALEEADRRRDPETLLAAVEKLVKAAESSTPGEDGPAPAKKPGRPRKTAQAKPDGE
jgi:hypothetical protein